MTARAALVYYQDDGIVRRMDPVAHRRADSACRGQADTGRAAVHRSPHCRPVDLQPVGCRNLPRPDARCSTPKLRLTITLATAELNHSYNRRLCQQYPRARRSQTTNTARGVLHQPAERTTRQGEGEITKPIPPRPTC